MCKYYAPSISHTCLHSARLNWIFEDIIVTDLYVYLFKGCNW